MYDLTIELEDRPGTLAKMGQAFGSANVSVEGGGAWVENGHGVAHFLVEDPVAARAALEASGILLRAVNKVVVLKLRQDVPGQLGKICQRMSDAGVNIEALYSDHQQQLILVVDNFPQGDRVAKTWMRERNNVSAPLSESNPAAASPR